ncbi:cytochrome b561 [Filomicrobium insigne]|uniref:Cytochrome b561 n=1 Tax=Filomicrobium insigne TaxID=418854 RepID=A0A1H0GKL3_9HYPH|nr:cytochrome b/b6 domain-containing protein [Filomicrobium insigne]SDO07404.1 cytochrome b561 [Filomicrobium insigne]
MDKPSIETIATTSGDVEIYSLTARTLHWLVVVLLAVQIPVGFYMAYRGNDLNIWDALTNNLYSLHKLGGLAILAVVILRLLYRLTAGAPRHEPSLEGWQCVVSELNHWGLYLLLLVVPVLGYLGVAYFPALDAFGFKIPALVAPDKAMSETVFFWHMVGAFALLTLIAMHIGAALFHYIIRGDNVLGRMLPGLLRRV